MSAAPAPSVREQLQATLGAAYTLARELGGGGMSRVFVAREEALGRDVVVKVLAPELAAGLSAERFAREITLAAGLQEPHIVPVLTAGVTAGAPPYGGLPYYTMPFVRGESLRAWLEQGRTGEPLSVGEAVAVLRAVAEALEYAHARGVVHRDIKPENVLLSGRTAVVTDFGIAKALQASRTVAPDGPAAPTMAGLTREGTSLGTPAYMAPEQAAGEAVDARADVYAWGVVAYELLAGRHPFAAATSPRALLAAHLGETPAPLGTAAPATPPALAALVARCLAKDPADRPPSAADLLAVLDGVHGPPSGAPAAPPAVAPARRRALVGGAAGLLVLAAAGGLAWRHAARADAGGAEATDTGAPRVAVLPFENAGPADQAYIAEGLTDEVRSRLAAVPGLTVIARASSNQYRAAPGQPAKAPEVIARELGVRYLLTGTVRSAPGAAGRSARVRVTPELVEVRDAGAPVSRWQQALDADAADVFAMEADIAGRVAGALDVALSAGTRAQLAVVPTKNPAAYDAYLRGEAITHGTEYVYSSAPIRQALDAYRQATTLDSTFAEAWGRRAEAAMGLYNFGAFTGTPAPARAALATEARTAATRAQALAPTRPAGAVALGEYAETVLKDPARALSALTEARRLAPGDAEVLGQLASLETRMPGRLADAIRDYQAAVARDPRDRESAAELAGALLRVRRYPEAQAAADRALALAPASPRFIALRARVPLAQGDLAGARRVLAAAPPEARDALLADVGRDNAWVLDDADQRRLLTFGPAAYGGVRGRWAWAQAQTYAVRGDTPRARAYADTALQVIAALRREPAPRDFGWGDACDEAEVLSVLGRRAEAEAATVRCVAMWPDAYNGPSVQTLRARVYARLGEPARALDDVEALLRTPSPLSPGLLRIDPLWAPLRGNPRYERLAAGH